MMLHLWHPPRRVILLRRRELITSCHKKGSGHKFGTDYFYAVPIKLAGSSKKARITQCFWKLIISCHKKGSGHKFGTDYFYAVPVKLAGISKKARTTQCFWELITSCHKKGSGYQLGTDYFYTVPVKLAGSSKKGKTTQCFSTLLPLLDNLSRLLVFGEDHILQPHRSSASAMRYNCLDY